MIDSKTGEEVNGASAAAESWVDEYDQLRLDSNSWVKEFGEGASKVIFLQFTVK